MSFFNYLLFSTLCVAASLRLAATDPPGKDCASIEASKEISQEGGKFKVTVTVKGGVSPYQYLFYSSEGNILSKDLSSNTVRDVGQGKYFCIVRDGKNCRKTIEIEVK